MKKGTHICEATGGNSYPYPLNKSYYTTNGQWVKFTHTIGQSSAWYGEALNWGLNIPADVKYMKIRLMYYQNTSGQDIKLCDIRLTSQTPETYKRKENNIIL